MRIFPMGILLAAFFSTSVCADLPQSCRSEFRVFDWNVSGADESWNRHKDEEVAYFVVHHATLYDANVITLQEVTPTSLSYIEAGLPGWDCQSHTFASFEAENDNLSIPIDIAVCVDGTASNFQWTRLTNFDNLPPPMWWGYVQVDYEGVRITSVHTQNGSRREHVTELHEDLKTGIVSGDYNFDEFEDPTKNPNFPPNPEFDPTVPDWYQTDLDWEWTIDGYRNEEYFQEKVDHVLTIEKPQYVDGYAGPDGDDNPPEPFEPFHSAHRSLFAELIFDETPTIAAEITNTEQPIEVDGNCTANVDFKITLHHYCCLDPDNLGLEVTASNPTANATLGPVTIDSINPLGQRDVEVTGHVAVSALQSCPAEIVVEATAQDCFGHTGDTVSQGTGTSVLALDTMPPEVGGSDRDLYCLWPPNHKRVCFGASEFNPDIIDNCTANPTWEFVACTSNQPDNSLGDGNTINDCVLDADGQGFCARSERTGGIEDGRHYDLDIRSTDTCENVSTLTEIGNVYYVPLNQNPTQMCLEPPASRGRI